MNHSLHARASAIAEGWERLCRTPLWHAAGCRCAGGAGCLLINLASTETDLLESLIAQARSNADEPAAALVLQRLESARQGAELPPFGDWLRSLAESALPAASIDRLLGGVERFADSLKAPAPTLKYIYLEGTP